MDTNVILQIVIALVAMFWLLSTACSYVVEGINSIFRNLRAQALERFICEMIIGQDKVKGAFALFRGAMSTSAAADPLGLLSHGLITSLRKPQSNAGGEGTPPTYIPANIFSKALLDRLASLALTIAFDVRKTQDLIKILASQVSAPGNLTPSAAAWQDLMKSFQELDPQASGLYAFGRIVFDGPADETLDEASARLTLLLASLSVASIGNLASPEARAIAVQMAALLRSGIECIERLQSLPTKGRVARLLDWILGSLEKSKDAPKPGQQKIHSLIEPGAMWMLAARNMDGAPVAGQNLLDAFAAVVEQAPLPRSLREALRPIFANADFDLAMVRAGIESWYDDVMQRASGWFKRHTTWTLFAVGLIAAIALNVNPFLVVGDLARDPELRTAGVAFAQEAATQAGPVVGQQILFAKAADSLKWRERVARLVRQKSPTSTLASSSVSSTTPTAASSPASTAAAASAAAPASAANSSAQPDDSLRQGVLAHIALEMQPLLLRSGSFVGLIPASRDSLNSGGSTTAYRDDDERVAYLASVCRARLEDTSRPPSEANANKIALNIIPDTARWNEGKVCAELHSQFAKSATPAEDHDVFWKSPDVVWVPDLAIALRNAEAMVAASTRDKSSNPAVSRENADKAIGSLLLELDRAEKFAGKTKRLADDFLDRIPSLGWKLDPNSLLSDSGTRAPTWGDMMKSAALEFWSAFAERWGVLGWPVTALMVSFGAPFWFDLMSKLVNRRVTGPKPTDGET